MFTVLHNNTEYPINLIRSADYDVIVNDIPELSMIVIKGTNNPGYPYLQEEAVIIVEGHEWRIKALSELVDYKNITAMHIAFDLIDMPFNQLLNGVYSPRNLLTTILSGTGFTLDLDEYGLTDVTLRDFGRKNPWKLLKDATDLLQAEFELLPNRVICVRKKLSNDKGQQLRYGYNLKSITKKTDSSDVVTHVIINYGEDYSQTAEFVSPTADNYNRAYYADIVNDERITDPASARKRAERMFKDIDLSYEKNIARTGESYELGETVHTIYEPLNDLSITTRILKMSYEWNGEEFDLVAVTVGNYVFKTADEIYQDEQDKAIGETNEKIDETKEVINKTMTFKFRETEEKMLDQYTTVTSEYNAAITLSAQEIRTDMNAKVQTINNDMTNIRTDVSSVIQTAALIETRVNSQQLTIDSQGTRISSAESSISQQANQIALKVSQTDYNGSTITSLINQDPYAVSISASKINLTGAVMVNGSISGATDINVNRDIYVGNNIYLAPNGGGSKSIIFDGVSRIVGDWSNINISAPNVRMDGNATIGGNGSTVSFGGTVNFAYANLVGVAEANSSGIGISTSGGFLYVQVNGSTIGSVKLT